MIVFMPVSSAAISSALLALSRSPGSSEDGQSVFPVFKAIDQSLWMQVDTDYEINVHPEAELNGIADILQPWIDAGHLPADTNTQLAALVESKRGDKLVVYDAFPALFKLYDAETNPTGQGKTYEMMIAAGLLAEPVMP
jgi:hypothetical protein